ncbi:MAG: helix-turn-helix domain-containing protein [Acutalibacteraceae bacterium]|jgi:transcriptional regulator with XRE-family HTH domain
MDNDFIRNRISALRLKKGVSEYKMSFDLGHSKGYIQSITSGRAYPSLSELLYICEYFGITPRQFFDEEIEEPHLVQELYALARDMDEEDLQTLIAVAKRIKK